MQKGTEDMEERKRGGGGRERERERERGREREREGKRKRERVCVNAVHMTVLTCLLLLAGELCQLLKKQGIS